MGGGDVVGGAGESDIPSPPLLHHIPICNPVYGGVDGLVT